MSLMSLWFSHTNFLLRLPASSYQLLNIGRCKLRTSEVATPTRSSWLWGLLDTVLLLHVRPKSDQCQVCVKDHKSLVLRREGGYPSLPGLFFFPLESERWRIRFLTSLFFYSSAFHLPSLQSFIATFSPNLKRQEPVSQACRQQVKASYVSLIGRSYGFLSSHPHNWKAASRISYKLLTFVSKSCKLLLLGVHWAVYFSVPSSHWRMYSPYLWHHAYTSFGRQTWWVDPVGSLVWRWE